MPAFKPIKQNRIYEEVLKQLKDAILACRYRPGQKLPSEREMCRQFQVSRAVIREAVRALELAGFVQLRQGSSGGAYVRDLSLDRLTEAFADLFFANKLSTRELVQTRLYLEPEIARLAALNIRAESKSRLEKAFEAEHCQTVAHSQWVARNLKIHYLLAEISGNRFYAAILNSLLDLTREMVLVVKPNKKVIRDHREHLEIVATVCAGDQAAAVAAMTRHISNVGAALIELETAYRRKKGLGRSCSEKA